MLRSCLTCLVVALVVPGALAASPRSNACFAASAATHEFRLGLPEHSVPVPDGRSVLYLRSGPRDTRLHLYQFDLSTGRERELAAPSEAPEHLSVEEKARRQRARMTLSGITDYAVSRDGRTVLASEADRLEIVSMPAGTERRVGGSGWIAPRLSPDGRFATVVRDDDLYVLDLATGADRRITTGGTETLTHGLAEFVAAEELDRSDGTWWSPDSQTLLYEASDTSGVEPHFIDDPGHPERAPVEFRYPRAGTANARVRLGLVGREGGATRWVNWDSVSFPYLVRVVWPEGHGKLTLVVMNRAQTEQRLLAVDPASGRTALLMRETDTAWIDTSPGVDWKTEALPRWLPDGSGFLWASEGRDGWQLELHRADGTLERVLTPASLGFLSLDDVDVRGGTVTVLAAPDSTDALMYRVPLAGGRPVPIAAEPGQHEARFAPDGHGIFVDRWNSASLVRDALGHVLATLPSRAEPPPGISVEFTRAAWFDAAIVRPSGLAPGTREPVVLSVYAGPGVKMVVRDPRRFVEDQCLANRGFIVVTIDGRGTPLRGHDWERAIRDDLIDVPLEDQVAGLQALGRRFPELDLSRVGVTGWSFGGYMTAMATIRRPDVFKVGVAGAPPVDWTDYDTAYTERYLGMPGTDAAGYRRSDVTTYAAGLARPLLIIHGLTDDNVYFVNTFKLTQALLEAGRPYDLLLLPGTHLLPDPSLRARVDEARAEFLERFLR